MRAKPLLFSLRFWIFPAVASLILTILYLSRAFVIGQGIPHIDLALTYQNCEAKAHLSNTSTESCRTNFPKEAEYKDCLTQTPTPPHQDPKSCEEFYITSVVTDSFNKCSQNQPENIPECQEFYGLNSIFANCFKSSKNLTICDKVYGLK